MENRIASTVNLLMILIEGMEGIQQEKLFRCLRWSFGRLRPSTMLKERRGIGLRLFHSNLAIAPSAPTTAILRASIRSTCFPSSYPNRHLHSHRSTPSRGTPQALHHSNPRKVPPLRLVHHFPPPPSWPITNPRSLSPSLYLFPSSTSSITPTLHISVVRPSADLVLTDFDATWQHARETVRAGEVPLPFTIRVCLGVDESVGGERIYDSELILRKELFVGCISTMEVVS
ncbi:hypothetical protein ACSQ67_026105 [Phaseolus vulgaris]